MLVFPFSVRGAIFSGGHEQLNEQCTGRTHTLPATHHSKLLNTVPEGRSLVGVWLYGQETHFTRHFRSYELYENYNYLERE